MNDHQSGSRRRRGAFALLAVGVVLGCGGGRSAAIAQSGVPAQDQQQPQLPVGFGTLKQDEFTIALRNGQALLIKVTPLNENVIRTAAPDTYQRLHNIAESRRPEAARLAGASGDLELFQVSFFSYEPDVVFQPENLQITHQGRQMRAAAIVALTPGWGRQRLAQQEDQRAIYAFAGKFDYNQGITVRYGQDQSDAWSEAIVSKVETERVKIMARAGVK